MMRLPKARTRLLAALLVVPWLAIPRQAHALQPLSAFVQASRDASFDGREAKATLEQREAEAAQARWKLVPTLSASASYTKNQYEAAATIPTGANTTTKVTITPEDQRDAFFTLNVPIVDIGAWQRIGAANRTMEAADARRRATTRDVDGNVTKAYFQVLANDAVLASAQRSLDAKRKNLAFVETRRAGGVASELDARRAQAEVDRANQDVAEAIYQAISARRSLETESGLTADDGRAPTLVDDLHPEAPLTDFMATPANDLPDVLAASKETVAQETTARATRAGLYPTLAVTGTERFTNATGFSGQSSFYQIVATAQIKLDGSVLVQARAQDAAAVAARAREEKARRAAMDRIFNAHARVAAQIDKARSARAQVASSELAADLARQRYQAGTANFIDVTVAERDLFSAEVSSIQADADLAYARADLRLAAGRPVESAR